MIRSLLNREFFGVFMSAAFLVWTFEHELGVEELAPFPLLIAAALTGMGFHIIFLWEKSQ